MLHRRVRVSRHPLLRVDSCASGHVGLLLGHWFFLRWSTYEVSWDPPPDVSADGRTIRLSHVGGSPTGDCRTEGRISVDERQDRVVLTVTVSELRFTGACNGAGYRRIAVAHLDQALGQRKLVDGHKF